MVFTVYINQLFEVEQEDIPISLEIVSLEEPSARVWQKLNPFVLPCPFRYNTHQVLDIH